METPTPYIPDADSYSTVDASRPFHSVKEAVAIFGKRVLLGKVQSPLRTPLGSAVEKVTSSLSSEFTPTLEKPVFENVMSTPSSVFTPTSEKPAFENVTSSPSSVFTSTSEKPAIEKVTSSPLTEFTPTSEKPPGVVIEIGTPDSSEFTHSPYKPLNIASKEAVDSSVYETSPSPVIPKNENEFHPSSRVTWDKGVLPSPNTSSTKIEPTLTPENLKGDKHGKIVHGNDLVMMLMILKRLESELQETKMEVKLLKERESETEVALASLNAELHKNMSKVAKAEGAEAEKAAMKSVALADEGNPETVTRDEEKRSFEVTVKNVDSPTLAQILSISDYDCYFGDKKMKKKMKKKPIIPLVTDIFPWRKRSTPSKCLSTPIYSWQ